jgi:hypothetical protein
LDPCLYDISNSELPPELDPAILTLSPGTSCISELVWNFSMLSTTKDSKDSKN